MAKFIFDCDSVSALRAAYKMVDSVKSYVSIIKNTELAETTDKKAALMQFIGKAMDEHAEETAKFLSGFWILEDGECAPNVFVTLSAFFKNEVAVDFFTSALPSLLALSNGILQKLTSKN